MLLFVGLYEVLLQVFQLLPVDARLCAALVAGIALLRFAEHRPPGDLGFALDRKAPLQFGVGMAVGVVGLTVACLSLVISGAIRYEPEGGSAGSWVTTVTNAVLIFAIPAAAEEAMFRGYGFQKLVDAFGAIAATIMASVLFAWAHRHNPAVNGFALFNIGAAGVMLSVAYLRTGSLWFATGLHLAWNWTMASLFDLPVSGLRLFDTPLYDAIDRGPVWFTGGSFGPEAGVSGLLGITLITACVVWITRNREWLTYKR